KEPYYDIGAVAIRRIIKEIDEGIVEDEDTYLPIQIIKRESTRKI
ncbi:MAG: LacI family transcriptional regulator, partial [Tissierellia bacterium]|nr:LacI family transcriptional regulator [Tissierellia bacterium]